MIFKVAYPLLKSKYLLIGKSVRLSNDRDQVDLGVEALHNLDIQRLERVTCGLDEEDASMDAVVHNVDTVDLVLGIQVRIETLLDVVGDWSPRLVVVHKVTKTGGIDNSQA